MVVITIDFILKNDYNIIIKEYTKGGNQMITETKLTDDKQLRERYINRVEVLDKVKELFLIPEMEIMTMRQVAEYFEVDIHTIQVCYDRNKEEVGLDGVVVKTPRNFKEIFKVTSCAFKNLEQKNGKLIIYIDDNTQLVIPNRGVRCFSKRAVLRMGMLLRDSPIAQEVRTQLLNITEKVIEENPEVAVEEIENEQKYLNDIMEAFRSGSVEKVLAATAAYTGYQNRHIEKLKKSNEELLHQNDTLSEDNSILTGNILAWSNRASANKVVRLMAQTLDWSFGVCWNEIYNELLYRHGINLRTRRTKSGKRSSTIIEYLHDDEWTYLYKTIAAMLQARYVNPSEIFNKAKVETT